MSRTGQPRCRFAVLDVPRGTGFGRHRHDMHQLLSVESGALAVGTAAEHWAVPARRGVWLPADLDHELVAIDDARVTFAYIAPGSPSPDPISVGVVAIRPLLREAVDRLARPGGARGPRRERLEAVFLDEVADLHPESRLVVLPAAGPARSVADQLLADPSERRNLDELGRAAGASSRTLQRRFRSETGLTFQQWRRRARVQSSMGHLADGASVTSAAHRCGFSSSSAFIAAFRSETGTTPTAWRARLA
ncbi:MAG: AraC family transcriptional regulator [Acidimicrobiales bacterium]